MKKQLIAGVMLVVAHTAGAAQGDDTELQQIFTEAGIQGICSAGMLTVREEARDEIVPQNVRRAWRDFRAQLASAYPATAEKKAQGEEAVPAGTKPGTEHRSAAD